MCQMPKVNDVPVLAVRTIEVQLILSVTLYLGAGGCLG